jgi:hypothetical protein
MKAHTLTVVLAASLVALLTAGFVSTAGAVNGVTTAQTISIASRTVSDVRTADGNTLVDQEVCGTASLANGGAYNWCHDESLVVHPGGNWTFNAKGQLTGSFPGCGAETSNYDINGNGPALAGSNLVGSFRANSIDSANNTAGFHFDDSGDLTPAVANSTFKYTC